MPFRISEFNSQVVSMGGGFVGGGFSRHPHCFRSVWLDDPLCCRSVWLDLPNVPSVGLRGVIHRQTVAVHPRNEGPSGQSRILVIASVVLVISGISRVIVAATAAVVGLSS